MEGIESPLYKCSEVKIYKDSVRPHNLASIGRNKTFFIKGWDQMILQIGDQEDSPQLIWED